MLLLMMIDDGWFVITRYDVTTRAKIQNTQHTNTQHTGTNFHILSRFYIRTYSTKRSTKPQFEKVVAFHLTKKITSCSEHRRSSSSSEQQQQKQQEKGKLFSLKN